jgi:heterodisulfide reductase subunit C
MAERPRFAQEVAALPEGKDIEKCIQCGMCTASCAVGEAVAGFGPRRIIAMVLLGLREEVLSSDEIWYCARCQCCVADCRKDIRPGDIITAIRTVAIRAGYKETPGARHTRAFLEDIERAGKLNEALLPLKTLRLSVIKLVPYAVRMLAKLKVPLPFVKPITNLEEVRDLIKEFKKQPF